MVRPAARAELAILCAFGIFLIYVGIEDNVSEGPTWHRKLRKERAKARR